ncbi:hypothetical protein AB0D62_10240 [Streptomyces massasporeus]|uniref:hypothetical protein n=1 Tax=Streptomyces massasporeus TaxID=67324 RepID=UPI0033F09E66
MTDDGFMGPPWQMDWTLKAQAARDTLPENVRKTVDAAPDGMQVRPLESSRPKGPRILHFDNGHGWMTYTFIPRVEDPQIVVEEVFWQ